MATSSLLGIDRAPGKASGRDTEDLGPSDTSDSGSDVAGLQGLDDGDPGLYADTATDPDSRHSDSVPDAFADGVDSDHTGTGERRSAAGDAGRREAADINPDRVVSNPDGFDLSDDEGDSEDLLAAEDDDGDGRPDNPMALAEADIQDADDDGVDDAEDDSVDAEPERPRAAPRKSA